MYVHPVTIAQLVINLTRCSGATALRDQGLRPFSVTSSQFAHLLVDEVRLPSKLSYLLLLEVAFTPFTPDNLPVIDYPQLRVLFGTAMIHERPEKARAIFSCLCLS